MRIRSAVFVMCFCGAFAWGIAGAQSPPPNGAVSQADLCTATGRVARFGTGEPIRGATVVLSVPYGDLNQRYSAQTDEGGGFAIKEILPGRYTTSVEHDGYVTQFAPDGWPQSSQPALTLSRGETSHELNFHLLPWAVIAGKVTDEDGEPFPFATVLALRRTFNRGMQRLQTAGFGQTNDLGEFRIWGLRPGRYFIRAADASGRARGSGVEERDAASQIAYPPGFYPGTQDASQAITVAIRGGEELSGLDIRLTPERAFRIFGRAYDAVRGQPMRGCCVYIFPAEDVGFRSYGVTIELDPAKGTFEIQDVVPGSYDLMAATIVEGRRYSARIRAEVANKDAEGVVVVISRGTPVRGRVSMEGAGTLDVTRMSVLLLPADDQLGQGFRSGHVKADGTFEVDDVSEGNYRVLVGGPRSGPYTKSATAGGQEVLESSLVVGAAGIKGSLDIVMSTAGAAVEGVVVDSEGQAVAGATVVLVPDGERRKLFDFYRNTTTDQYGRFVFGDVRPGGFKAFSWREVELGAWQDPDFMKPIEDQGVRITAEENGHSSIQLKVLASDPAASP
ncbi:MAG TPA: carboxypeptidase-like regulatory domain-containing protein [Candidatus Acidoferrales bacterium]|nr:carboxypeptidase-like regulatory domain-containing protein [Candidatus Acidoferrales bacterium]